jgi:hypothetical protein
VGFADGVPAYWGKSAHALRSIVGFRPGKGDREDLLGAEVSMIAAGSRGRDCRKDGEPRGALRTSVFRTDPSRFDSPAAQAEPFPRSVSPGSAAARIVSERCRRW